MLWFSEIFIACLLKGSQEQSFPSDKLKEGSFFKYNFITLILWSTQHVGEAGSAAGKFFLVRILIEFSVLAAQQNIHTAHYPLLQAGV